MTRHGHRAVDSSAPRGFTMVELVVTISLLLVVSGSLLASYVSVMRAESFVRGRTETLDELRLTLSRVTRDVRQGIAVDPSSTPGRLEVDTFVMSQRRTLVFEVVGRELVRRVDGGPPVTLVDGVVDPAPFAYEPDTAAAEVVHITLVVEPPDEPETTLTVESDIRLRNRGFR